MSIAVSIINPRPISREGLRRIIADGGIDVIATFSGVAELPATPTRTDHLLLVDVPTLAEQVGSLQALGERGDWKVLILAEKFDLASMLSCFDHGAQGYAVKDMPCATLIALLQLAALGHKVMPSDLADVLKHEDFRFKAMERTQESASAVPNALSQRENDVLSCLMAGYANKHIARTLDVTEATVKVHVKAILRKLNVTNRTQAAMWATSRGMNGRLMPYEHAMSA